MIQLQLSTIDDVKGFQADFEKRSEGATPLSEEQLLLGIYDDKTLVGYFAVKLDRPTFEVQHGYLTPAAQGKGIPAKAMHELEVLAKRTGFTEVALATARSYKAYTKFMGRMGYAPDYTVYSKRI